MCGCSAGGSGCNTIILGGLTDMPGGQQALGWPGRQGNRALCPSSSRLVQGKCRIPKIREKAKHNVSVLLDSLHNHVSMILWSKASHMAQSDWRVGETDSTSWWEELRPPSQEARVQRWTPSWLWLPSSEAAINSLWALDNGCSVGTGLGAFSLPGHEFPTPSL